MKSHTKAVKTGIALALVCACSGAWGAAFNSLYRFDTPEQVPTLANATYTPFSRTGLVPETRQGIFASSGWETGSSQNSLQFVQFTLTPDPGFFLTMTSISFDVWHRDTDAGPLSGAAEIFLGIGPGMTSMESVQYDISTPRPAVPVTFDFADFSGADNQGITVRFYGWNASQLNDRLFFDAVRVDGDLSPVPEPVNVALAAFGVCLVGAAAHRRFRAKNGLA